MRPSLFLDTSICVEAVKRKGCISAEAWSRVQRAIRADYRCCISYATLKELLVRLARSEDEFFAENKRALCFLIGGRKLQNITYLDKPPIFAIQRLLGRNVRPRIEIDGGPPITPKEWVIGVVTSVLKASSKATLKRGVKFREFGRTRITFDLDDFDTFENEPQTEHADLLEGIRTGQIDRGDRITMSAWLLKDAGLTPYSRDCEKLSTHLDAAWRYAHWLCTQTKNPNYDFRRHRSDWDDVTQLFYLCDPDVHLLTLDRDFKIRTKGSTQSDQIHVWEDFLAGAGPSCYHAKPTPLAY